MNYSVSVTGEFEDDLDRYKSNLARNNQAQLDLGHLYNAVLNDRLPIGVPKGNGRYEFIIGNEFGVIYRETNYGAKFLSLRKI